MPPTTALPWREMLDFRMAFPAVALDLRPFVSGPQVDGTGRFCFFVYGPHRNVAGDGAQAAALAAYDIFAVCQHHGDTATSGHYTALCRHPGPRCMGDVTVYMASGALTPACVGTGCADTARRHDMSQLPRPA
jgi:hypothetical protein